MLSGAWAAMAWLAGWAAGRRKMPSAAIMQAAAVPW
jgi:hypothetical protein